MRELWAKIAVESRDDVKLICRPEWERLLWVNLILLCKEKTTDGLLRGYSSAMLRQLCTIRARPSYIQEALAYFQSVGMITVNGDDIQIVNYVKRQGDYDIDAERQKWRERKARQRDKSRDVTAGHGTNVTDVPPLEESRGEEKRLDKIPLKPPQGGATSHPFRSSRKAQAEPYVATCAGCAERGHNFRDCPQRVAILARQNES